MAIFIYLLYTSAFAQTKCLKGMSNSHLGYLAGCMNQTKFLLLLCNACECSDHSINQFLSFDQFSGSGDSQHRLKEAKRGSNPLRTELSLKLGRLNAAFVKAPWLQSLCSCSTRALRLYKESQQDTREAGFS